LENHEDVGEKLCVEDLPYWLSVNTSYPSQDMFEMMASYIQEKLGMTHAEIEKRLKWREELKPNVVVVEPLKDNVEHIDVFHAEEKGAALKKLAPVIVDETSVKRPTRRGKRRGKLSIGQSSSVETTIVRDVA